MTESIEITEQDFANLMGVLGINGLKSQHWETINKIVINQNQILQTLREYPKIKEKWDLYVKFSREGFYSFDCEPEDGSIWGGCVKRSKIDQDHKLLYEKINECIKLKDKIEELKLTIETMKYDRNYSQ